MSKTLYHEIFMQIGEGNVSDPVGVIRGVSGANFRDIDTSLDSQESILH